MQTNEKGKLLPYQRERVVSKFPLFFLFNTHEIHELSLLADEIYINSGDSIVEQGSIVDSFYLIVSGSAVVRKTNITVEKTDRMDIANLGPGDAIGLSLTGFFSSSGVRSSSVIANSPMNLLCFQIKDFNRFLKQHGHNYPTLKKDSDILMLLKFLKDLHVFNQNTTNQVNRIAKQVKRLSCAKGEMLFRKGESANQCYFLIDGEINITNNEHDTQKACRLLKPVTFLGEEALLEKSKYSADATAHLNSELFVLERSDIKKLIVDNEPFFNLFRQAHMNRLLPIARPYSVLTVEPKSSDVTIKVHMGNVEVNLNEKEYMVLNSINGKRSLLYIINHSKELEMDELYATICSLHKKGVVDIPNNDFLSYKQSSIFIRLINQIKSLWK